MSRRKQARPRSCKRNEDGSENGDMLELDQEEDESEKDVKTPRLSMSVDESNEGSCVDPDTTVEENVEQAQSQTNDADKFHCGSCGITFTNLDQFMDHKNFDCSAVTENDDCNWDIEDGDCLAASRSDTPTSFGSLENSKSPGTSSESPISPSVENLSPDLVPYSVGVNENNPYACHYCEKAFVRLSFLKVHEQVHSNHMPFKCPFCERLFRHKRSRDRHVKLHTGDKKYKCHHCDSAFARSDHLKSHLRTHDNGKPFPCTVCNRGYTTSAALTSHMLSHKKASSLQIKDYQCLQCTETFDNSNDLQSHIETHALNIKKEKSHSCLYCSELFYSAENLDLHVEDAHMNNNINKCPICYDCFTCSEELCEHLKIHDTVSMEIDSMMLDSSNSAHVSSHISTTTPGNSVYSTEQLVCPYCFQGDFDSLELIEIHMQSVHSVKPTEIYTCNYCNAPYPNLYTLHEHMRAVHQNQPCMDIKYPCSLCSQEYPSIETLVEHKKMAHGYGSAEKPLIDSVYCVQCSLAFSSPASLQEHVLESHQADDSKKLKNKKSWNSPVKEGMKIEKVKSNTPLSPGTVSRSSDIYQEKTTCDQCNATFHNFKNFQAHMKIHLDATMSKFVCKQCKKSFPTEDQLESHSTSHFLCMATEYGCTSCRKLFGKPDELQKHLMDIHAHHLYRCSLCKEIFDSKVNIQVHFAIKHSNECKLYKCTHCQSVFRSEMEWQVHVRVSHLHMSKPYRCLFCKESFTSEMDLQCHLTTHNKPFKCSMCEESFHVEYLLDKHLQSVHVSAAETHAITSPIKVKVEKDVDVMSSQGAFGNDHGTGYSPGSSGSNVSGIWKSAEPLHTCNICDLKFSQISMLQLHKSQDHGLVKLPSLSPKQISPKNKTPIETPTPMCTPEPQKASTLATIPIVSSTVSSIASGFDKISLDCMYCSQHFKTRAELDKHMKIHINSGSQKCNICDEACPTASILAEHKLTHCKIQQGNMCTMCKVPLKSEDQFYLHSQEHGFQGTVMQCIICRQTLASMVELQLHGKHHFQVRPSFYTCCVCLNTFDSKENLISKLNSSGRNYYVCKPCYHGESSEKSCKQCSAKFITSAQLESHLATCHKKTFQCIKCQESFGSEYEIQVHVASHVLREGNIHHCKLCNCSFESPAKLQIHLIQHTYDSSEYRCSVCCKIFGSATEIQSHALEHGLGARRYACSQCSQKFFFSAELENHTFSHAEANIDPTEFKCHECNRCFSSIINLSNHKQIHCDKDSSYKCSLCSEIFTHMGSLQQHFFSCHSKVELEITKKTYKCPECNKEFPCLSNLQGHMRIHKAGAAHHTCPVCKKVFALSRNLNIHLRSHSGEKPYECPICKKRFARKENRKAHMRSHGGIKPFICPVCGKSFTRKCHVKDHLRVHFLQEGVSLNEQTMKDLGFQLDNEETNHSECLNSEVSDTELDGSIESPEVEDKANDEHMTDVDVEPCN